MLNLLSKILMYFELYLPIILNFDSLKKNVDCYPLMFMNYILPLKDPSKQKL